MPAFIALYRYANLMLSPTLLYLIGIIKAHPVACLALMIAIALTVSEWVGNTIMFNRTKSLRIRRSRKSRGLSD